MEFPDRMSSASHVVVPGVEAGGIPRRQRSSWRWAGDIEQALAESPEPYEGPSVDAGEAEESVGDAPQDLVLGDIGLVVVVPDEERNGQTETLPELVMLPEAATQHREGIVDDLVPLEKSGPQRPLGLIGEGLGQCGEQVGGSGKRDGVLLGPAGTVGVPEQEHQPGDRQLWADPDGHIPGPDDTDL
jgi:hypothetical protein